MGGSRRERREERFWIWKCNNFKTRCHSKVLFRWKVLCAALRSLNSHYFLWHGAVCLAWRLFASECSTKVPVSVRSNYSLLLQNLLENLFRRLVVNHGADIYGAVVNSPCLRIVADDHLEYDIKAWRCEKCLCRSSITRFSRLATVRTACMYV